MMFSDSASVLCGQCALLLGWRPHEFWAATPAELGCVLGAMMPQITEPLSPEAITKLKEQFPDG
jgi:hypothetical protein